MVERARKIGIRVLSRRGQRTKEGRRRVILRDLRFDPSALAHFFDPKKRLTRTSAR